MKKNISLIIGGSSGIGNVIFNTFSKKNKNVYILSNKYLTSNKSIQVNLSDNRSIDQTLKSKFFKKVKIKNLIFSQRFRGDSVYDHFKISFFSVVRLIEKLKGKMANNSSVVVINSNASNFITDDQSLGYHASKASLINLVKFYDVNLGDRQIRFNSILPGTTIKPANAKFFKKSKKYNIIAKKIIPLKRLGTSQDVANLVEFLCSDKASFITGQSIYLDGGLSLLNQEAVARKLI